MIYVLVSGAFETLDTPHKGDVLGQQFDMTEDVARAAILDGAQLLPKDAFDSRGFNAEEIAKYSNARLQTNAPATFQTKFQGALKAVAQYRASLAAPPAAAPANPAPPTTKAAEVKS